MRSRIVVLGDTNQDFIMSADAMPRPGETRMVSELSFAPGGKGGNQAVAAARCGAHVTLISAVGDDPFGARLLDGLEREGIVTDHVVRGANTVSGMAFIVLAPDGQNSILHAPGASALITPEVVDAARESIAGAQLLLMTLGVPVDAVRHAARIAREANTTVIFDPAPVCDGLDDMWPLTDICTPNETETGSITGTLPHTPEEAAVSAEWFRRHGVDTVIITMGSQGCVLLDDGGARLVRPYDVEVVDTTAAG
ncbi:MAG: ribokinase, partial [Armatimonadetes bacterium]|nr:ribokinase [Armatimonadota bacterium]